MTCLPEISTERTQSFKNHDTRVSFLDLPRELRDVVYDYAFRVQGAIFVYSPDPYFLYTAAKAMIVRHGNEGPTEPIPLANRIPISLLRSCRQLHSECSMVLYGINVFRIWSLGEEILCSTYRKLVRHVILTEEVEPRIFGSDPDDVGHAWKKRFWPSVMKNGKLTVERFPGLETMALSLKPPRRRRCWRFAFFSTRTMKREQRIALATEWLQPKCPWDDERVRDCLQISLVPDAIIRLDEYEGSRFAFDPEDEVQEAWDTTEFDEAFLLVKRLR
ncbi:hypothetical protein T440DRAFT_62926 [Plenodomus tracheiphilus IPT5]|uniref:F-box domain-containing protein n=1 Tax=Plenodomus tracheiphilus IPT5 TaxID=1408161 RepID=A0A6A7BAI0_9PLEO|nr:hypothetical protein T440DRAFT_62926 [Plenodomus tracheiphilus IPT5]